MNESQYRQHYNISKDNWWLRHYFFLYKIWYQKNIWTQRNVQWRLILMQFRTLCCSFALGLHSGLFSDAKKCNYLKCSLFSHPQNFSELSHNFWSKIELCALPSPSKALPVSLFFSKIAYQEIQEKEIPTKIVEYEKIKSPTLVIYN